MIICKKKAPIFLLAVIALCPLLGSAKPGNADLQPPKPLFIMIEYNPWAMVLGAESPTFALYEDGTVIYRKRGKTGIRYLSSNLSKNEIAWVLHTIQPTSLVSLKGDYALVSSHDQPMTRILYKKPDGSYKRIKVYGSLNPKDREPSDTDPPPLLTEIYRFVSAYDNPQAKEWLPSYVEVIVWPYEYAPEKDAFWPKGWPDLKDIRTVKRRDSYSIYLPRSRYPELKVFLGKLREKQAVRMNGRKWSVNVRFPFPYENLWML